MYLLASGLRSLIVEVLKAAEHHPPTPHTTHLSVFWNKDCNVIRNSLGTGVPLVG